jgi:gliding motility-associated-like protein
MSKTLSILLLLTLFSQEIIAQCLPPLVLTTSSTPTTCGLANGTANVLITDPIGSYTYSWSPGNGTTSTVTDLASGVYSVTVTDEHNCSVTASVTIPASSPISLTASNTNTLCNQSNGSATVSVTNGTSPFTYVWTPNVGNTATVQNLQAGNYGVTVTDANNCTANTTVSIIATNAPVVSVNIVPSSCTGSTGSATLSATGGTGNYNYMWLHDNTFSPTKSNLAAGTYVVLVTDGNCSVFQPVTITKEQNTLTVHTFTRGTGCGLNDNGEVVVVTGSGSTPPYTYLWSPNVASSSSGYATNLGAGVYTVTVTDANGCTKTQTGTVTTVPIPVVTILSVSHPTCYGAKDGFYIYSIDGSPPVTSYGLYSAGTYYDTLSVASPYLDDCRSIFSVTFIDPPRINASITTTPAACGVTNGGASIITSNGTAPYSYAWSNSNTTSAISAVSAGSYSVIITDANGCSVNEIIQIPSVNGPNLTMSSTPATCKDGTVAVTASGGNAPYAYSWSPSGGTNSTANNLSGGVYTVTVTDANNCISTDTVTVKSIHTLRLFLAGQPYTCSTSNTGSIYVSVSPSGSSSFQWLPNGETTSSIVNLPQGVYSVLVTNANGCTGFAESQIYGSQSSIAEVMDIIHPSCFGAKDGGYTVRWIRPQMFGHLPLITAPQSAFGLGAGPLTGGSTGDCGGGNFSITLIDPPQIISSVTSVPASCSGGGSATITVSGGTGAFTYLWSPSGGSNTTASNLPPGTYTVTATDANGCSVNETVVITSSGGLNLNATSTPASCGIANGSATVTPNGGNGPYTYSWSPSGGNNTTASNLAPDTYTVTVTDANNCSGTQTVVITASQAITLNTLSTPASCGIAMGSASVSVSGGAAPYAYTWSPNVGTTATISNLAAGNYTVTVADANNCTETSTIVVTGTAAVSPSVTSTPASCGVSNGTVTANPSGGTAPYTYYWASINVNTPSVTGLAPGNYTVTVTDATNTCSGVQTVTVGSVSGMTTTKNTTSTTCGLSNGIATVIPVGGTAPYTYTWSPNIGTTATISNLAAGNYAVTVTDANNCSSNETFTIDPSDQPIITVNTTQNSCGLNNGSLTANVIGGTTPYTYTWTPNIGNTPTISNLASGSYTITVTDANNCSSNETVILSPSNGLTLNSSSSHTTCGLNNGSATVSVTGGNTPYTYNWSPNSETTATASNLAAGTYTVTVTDLNNCSAIETFIINLSDVPSAILNTTQNSCGLNNGAISVIATGGTTPYTYTWSPNIGNTANISNLSPGNYSVTVTDANNCSVNVATVLNPSNALVTSATATQSSCGLNNGGISVTATGGTIPYTYTWSPNIGNTANHSNLSPGNYSVTVTDANNCTQTETITINTSTSPSASVDYTDVKCFGDNNGSISVTLQSGNPPYTYSWSPAIGSGNQISNLPAGTYSVSITDNSGCTLSETVTIQEPLPLSVTATGTHTSCDIPLGSLAANSTGGNGDITYTWQPGHLQGANQNNLAHGVYTVTATDKNDCNASASFTILFDKTLSINIIPSTSYIDAGESVNLNVISFPADIPGGIYTWSPETYLSCANCQDPIATPTQDMIYIVTLNTANGCIATDTAYIFIKIPCGDFFIPDIFSPNDDGNNDEFKVYGNCISSMKMIIYNRWGEKVFESKDQLVGWDGKLHGKPVDAATFVYVIEMTFPDGKTTTQKGKITLVR